MKPAPTTRRIIERLAEQHPNADTELHYRNPFELLAATILSAQSTDARVNLVTPALFARYPDAAALAQAKPATLEKQIVSTGFFRQKAKSLIGMATLLVDEHGGEVPANMDALTKLPGVGRKTANVVLGHALGVPGLPVDRHVLRVSNRIGIAEGEDPVAVEAQLCERLPPEQWTLASDVQILHGRRICRPKPLCDQCAVRDECDYYRNEIEPAEVGKTGPAKAGPYRENRSAKAGPYTENRSAKAGPSKEIRPAKAGPANEIRAAKAGRHDIESAKPGPEIANRPRSRKKPQMAKTAVAKQPVAEKRVAKRRGRL